MKKFVCYQDGKRCSSYGISGWTHNDTYDTQREAEIYCYLWAYPVTRADAEVNAPKMFLNSPVNFAMTEYPIMMEVRYEDIAK